MNGIFKVTKVAGLVVLAACCVALPELTWAVSPKKTPNPEASSTPESSATPEASPTSQAGGSDDQIIADPIVTVAPIVTAPPSPISIGSHPVLPPSDPSSSIDCSDDLMEGANSCEASISRCNKRCSRKERRKRRRAPLCRRSCQANYLSCTSDLGGLYSCNPKDDEQCIELLQDICHQCANSGSTGRGGVSPRQCASLGLTLARLDPRFANCDPVLLNSFACFSQVRGGW